MAKPWHEQCARLLYAALEAEIGIKVRCSNTSSAMMHFTETRKALGDPTLATLTIRLSRTKPDEELWIIKKERNNAKDQGE